MSAEEKAGGSQPPTGVCIPPGYEYTTVGEKPESFRTDVLMRAFSDYSVALGRLKDGIPCWLGSGVLVRWGTRFGILTAHHCLHACCPEVSLGDQSGDTLVLLLNRGHGAVARPEELAEQPLARPKSEEYGPDLSFVEIVSPQLLGTVKAISSFWSLDRPAESVQAEFGRPLTPCASVGYPEAHYNRVVEGNVVRHQIRHMVYDNAIGEGAVFERDGWDYLDSGIYYPGDLNLPASFSGMSGGPVWGMELRRNKTIREITLGKYALVGITFYQVYRRGDRGGLRAHFIRSIYDKAWTGLS
jgi:hypothetical protein